MLRQRFPGGKAVLDSLLKTRDATKPDSLRRGKRWLRIAKRTGVALVVIYFVLPAWFYFCPWIRRQCVFLHNFHWPPFETSNLSLPSFWNIDCAQNFYLESETGVKLGVWHMKPSSKRNCDAIDFDDHRPVILYLHGNSMNRAALYRRQLYGVLTASEIDAHVVTFDYRGYGDSTKVKPSVEGLVKDARFVYDWLLKRVAKRRVVIWGHSLGSGTAVQLASKLSQDQSPSGIVLESPFTNIPEATRSFPLSVFHRWMPYFDTFFSNPTRHPDTNFDTDNKIAECKAPLLILHAADDGMVNVKMGRKLKEIALKEQTDVVKLRAQYFEFDAQLGYGHLFISRSPLLPKIVDKFIHQVCN